MLSLLSPAKLNLTFSILHKRSDGFHEIASLYQAINLCDRLNFSFATEDRLVCTNPKIPLGPDNLVWKAVAAFRKKSSLTQPLQISLEKNIPHEAGLGGGSSNAATTLFALNTLFDFPLSQEELLELAASIGSDVAFFFSQGCAYCTGRGEKIASLPLKLSKSFTVVKPPYGLSTPLVYRNVDLSKLEKRKEQNFLKKEEISFFNDLEESALRIEPRLQELKDDLLSFGFDIAILTGSGTAFFCLGSGKLPKNTPLQAFKCKPIYRSGSSWY